MTSAEINDSDVHILHVQYGFVANAFMTNLLS